MLFNILDKCSWSYTSKQCIAILYSIFMFKCIIFDIHQYLFFIWFLFWNTQIDYAHFCENYNCNLINMDFRVRPSSKKSQQSDRSLVQLPAIRGFQSGPSEIRSVLIRLDNLQSNFSNYQDLWRRQRDISNASYLQLQKRIDMLQYKTFSNEKDVKQLVQRDFDTQMVSKNDGQIQNLKAMSQGQISTIKQALIQQRQAHRQYAKHQSQMYEQMSRRQMRTEAQLRELLNKQRDDYDHRLSDQLEEIRNNQNLKQKKMENQYQLMKTVITNTEKKVFAEFQRKLRNETVIKDFIEDKIAQIRQQMAAEQRTMVSKQSKFVRQIKQSIESIFAIIKNTQKQLTQQLSQTQKLSANNLKKLSTTIEMIKQKFNEDFTVLNAENSNLQNQMAEIKNFVNMKMEENREMLMDIEEENYKNSRVSRNSNQQAANGEQSAVHEGANSQKMLNLERQFNNWKAVTQQKNLNVFKQISSTLKTMKLEFKKQNDEMSTQVGSYKQSLANVKKLIPLEIKKSIQAIISIFNNQFDTLAQQLETITDMIALSKKEVQKNFKQQLKKSNQQTLKQVKQLIKIANKQVTLQTEKSLAKQEQSLRNYTDQEIKFVKDLLIQKNAALETQLNQVSQASKKNILNTTAQLEDFTLKLKTFNENFKDYIEEQRKDDMKKRIQLEETMRKNANNLMDIYYKKCQFLVEGMKKAIQMNIMKDMTTMKRDIQALKQQQDKNVFQTKQQILNKVNQKIDKLNQQRQSSQQVMHEAFDNQLNALRKNLSNQIGNSKLQMAQKINELIQSVNQLKQNGSQSTDQLQSTVQSLKQAVWKIQAMSFSQQAKNKAIMDRMGQDINDLSTNVVLLSNQLKPK